MAFRSVTCFIYLFTFFSNETEKWQFVLIEALSLSRWKLEQFLLLLLLVRCDEPFPCIPCIHV